MATGQGTWGRGHVPPKGSPPSCCAPFQEQRLLHRQARAAVIHKKHQLCAEGGNSHLMRRMLNSHWHQSSRSWSWESKESGQAGLPEQGWAPQIRLGSPDQGWAPQSRAGLPRASLSAPSPALRHSQPQGQSQRLRWSSQACRGRAAGLWLRGAGVTLASASESARKWRFWDHF